MTGPPGEALPPELLRSLLLPPSSSARARPSSPYLLPVNELCCIISPSRFSAQRVAPLPPASVRLVFPAFLPLHLFSLFARVIFRLRMPKAARKKEKRKKQILVHVSSEFGRGSGIGSYQNHNNVLDIHQGSVAKSCQFSCRQGRLLRS